MQTPPHGRRAAPFRTRADAGFLASPFEHGPSVVRFRGLRWIGVRVLGANMGERELSVACKQAPCELDRVAAALIFIDAYNDLPEHCVSLLLAIASPP